MSSPLVNEISLPPSYWSGSLTIWLGIHVQAVEQKVASKKGGSNASHHPDIGGDGDSSGVCRGRGRVVLLLGGGEAQFRDGPDDGVPSGSRRKDSRPKQVHDYRTGNRGET